MSQLVPLIIIVPLFVFWAWMFKAMTESEYLPPCFITISNGTDSRMDWTFAFIILNILTAIFYYATQYRNRQ
jgi:hypothetical protein